MTNALVESTALVEKIKEIKDIQITTEEDLFKYSAGLGRLKKTYKDIEKEMKSLTDPYEKEKKNIWAKYKPVLTILSNVTRVTELGILKFRAAEQKRLLALKSDDPIEAATKTIKTDNATVSIKKTWVGEIVELLEVPIEYWSVDEYKIKQAISEGARTIKGVKIYQKEGVSTRTK